MAARSINTPRPQFFARLALLELYRALQRYLGRLGTYSDKTIIWHYAQVLLLVSRHLYYCYTKLWEPLFYLRLNISKQFKPVLKVDSDSEI
jgi:hypothetical protein